MKVEILEVAGIIPAMQALRLPYSREPRSERKAIEDGCDGKIFQFDNTPYYGYISSNLAHIHCDDLALAQKLVKSGDEHGKCVRGIIAYLRVTAPRYFWQEFSTYRIGCECLSSTSTMHTITKGVTADMFDCDMHEAQEYYNSLQPLIELYHSVTDKDEREMLFRSIKRHIPECFLQTRILAVSFQTLRRIRLQRRNHRLVEWKIFCDAIERLPFAEQLILVKK